MRAIEARRVRKARSSFLKKEAKNFYSYIKVFWFFFSKKHCFLASVSATAPKTWGHPQPPVAKNRNNP
jgi:hypothetical protein